MQLKAFPTALSLARVTGRTLVLPPFEYYENQAQVFTNQFRQSASGKRPLFLPWSELFDLERLRIGADVVDFYETPLTTIDVGVLQTGDANTKFGNREAALEAKTRASLSGVMHETPCRVRRDGLQANLTMLAAPSADEVARPTAVDLYGKRLELGRFVCGSIGLHHSEQVQALAAWYGNARVAAVFNVGQHIHTKVGSAAHQREMEVLSQYLRPNARCDGEAARFVRDNRMRIGNGAAGPATAAASELRFVAVHWRHGDYVAYKHVQPAEKVAARVTKVLDELKCEGRCRVFLMTNCRNESDLAALASALPGEVAPLRYGSRSMSDASFAHEGRRLIIEAAIASRAEAFVGSPRSAVSELVEQLRRARKLDASLKTELR